MFSIILHGQIWKKKIKVKLFLLFFLFSDRKETEVCCLYFLNGYSL
ncbi:hypothetical protein BSM4216_0925 [Bacillus smithii]|nr:hypothetical protein BSM4216_0925 [Bacillus smithii]